MSKFKVGDVVAFASSGIEATVYNTYKNAFDHNADYVDLVYVVPGAKGHGTVKYLIKVPSAAMHAGAQLKYAGSAEVGGIASLPSDNEFGLLLDVLSPNLVVYYNENTNELIEQQIPLEALVGVASWTHKLL